MGVSPVPPWSHTIVRFGLNIRHDWYCIYFTQIFIPGIRKKSRDTVPFNVLIFYDESGLYSPELMVSGHILTCFSCPGLQLERWQRVWSNLCKTFTFNTLSNSLLAQTQKNFPNTFKVADLNFIFGKSS